MLLKVFVCLALLLTQARTCLHAQDAGVLYATSFHPPAQYRQWYRQAESCAGLKGDWSKIIWTVVPAPWKVWITDSTYATTHGSWGRVEGDKDGKAIILLNAEDWSIESYVKHEMLHDILWRNGKQPIVPLVEGISDSTRIRKLHPVPPFERCAPTYMKQMKEWEAQKNAIKDVYRP